jgi:iron complex outermembrane receptor protein
MKIADRWVVLLGGRYDWARDRNKRASATMFLSDRSEAFTGRAGLVYLADNGLAPFASFSQSFEPTTGLDRLGARLKPSRGEQYEAGLRFQPESSDISLSASLYQLTRTNVSVTDPVDTTFSTQRGKVRSTGVELEARGEVMTDTRITVAYAYTRARILESGPLTPELDGSRVGGVPRHQASLWVDHEFAASGIAGLKIGAGVRYIGPTTGTFVPGIVPDYALSDGLVSYSTGPWRISLNAANIFDKSYIASCTYGCFYGEARRVIAAVGLRW